MVSEGSSIKTHSTNPTGARSSPSRRRSLLLYPFHLDTATTSAETAASNRHDWKDQHGAWNAGKMDQWRAYQPVDTCLGYFTREDIPYHTALAQTFTVCDNYFCSVLGPTAPNRLYLIIGTIDAAGTRGGPATSNPPVAAGGIYHWKSYPEQLAAAGVDWTIYDEQANHFPPPFNLNVAAEFFSGWAAALQATPNGLRTGDGTFEHDLANHRLPTVSWLIPPYSYSEHPTFSPANGAYWISKKIAALLASPYWSSTVFVLTYDENDGAFDHVPPPVSPPATADEWVTTGSNTGCIGPGFRVPCIVVSPWTVGGHVCTKPLDHTSVLRLLEQVTHVAAANISAYRRQTLSSLADALDLSKAVAASAVPVLPPAPPYIDSHLPAPVAPSTRTWPPSLAHLGAVGWPGAHAYFFKGARYLRYTTGQTGVAQHPDAGYPKSVAGTWPEVSSVDAGVVMANGKAYLFSENKYVRYSADPGDPDPNASHYTPDPGYPALIWNNWPGFWASDLDAAVVWPNGKMYFFKGAEYIRCSSNAHVPDDGYPKPILGNWPGLGEAFPGGVDAAVVWSSETAYFFKGDKYVRYTITDSDKGVDDGYPKLASLFSPELASL